MALGHIPAATRADGQRRAGAARGAEDQAVPDDRSRNCLEQVAVTAPQLVARGRVIGPHVAAAANNQLVVVAERDRDRSAPAHTGRAVGAPPGLAALGVDRDDERPGGAPVDAARSERGPLVWIDDDGVAVQQRRAGRAVVVFDPALRNSALKIVKIELVTPTPRARSTIPAPVGDIDQAPLSHRDPGGRRPREKRGSLA